MPMLLLDQRKIQTNYIYLKKMLIIILVNTKIINTNFLKNSMILRT